MPANNKRRVSAAVEKRVERVFYAYCDRIPIPVLKLGELFAVGIEAVEAGADDTTLGNVLFAKAMELAKEVKA